MRRHAGGRWRSAALAVGLLLLVSTGGALEGRLTATAPPSSGGSAGTAPAAREAPGTPGGFGDETLRLAVTHSLVKIRPGDPLRGDDAADLAAARNEFESFQLALRSAIGAADVDVEAGGLRGAAGEIPAGAISVYREDLLSLRHPSSESGDVGDWPDPLIPRVDRYVGERRDAFPFDLEAGRTRAAWIEIYVPIATPPGSYRGEVTISVAGQPRATIPVRLRVWPFTLPSTSSLDTSFGISGLSILEGHFGTYTNDDDLRRLTRLYARAALLHRITIHGGTMIPPRGRPVGNGWRLYWEDYDREVGPFLDGTVLADADPLPGARATSAMVRTPADLGDDELAAYWHAWADHFQQRGWLDRLFLYLWDEPQGPWQRTPFRSLNLLLAQVLNEPVHEYAELEQRARLARRADERLVTAVTEQRIPSMDRVIDRWIPLVNCLEMKPGYPSYCEETVGREAYVEHEPRERPWFYQSCGSHGCDDVGDEYFSGWPSYMIDTSAPANRIMQWLAWRYRMGGELYHNMTQALGGGRDAWSNVYLHGGNGDGTFFYPGRPDVIGGTTDIPVESVRLKILRDGLEDFEYLRLLGEMGERDLADRIVAELAPAAFDWNPDPEALLANRRRIGERIAALTATSPAD